MKKTKQNYERILNNIEYAIDRPQWIIGGKMRHTYAHKSMYGTALRTYDPIAFEVGFNEWRNR